MQVIADLQIHSKFSRAVSREMTLPNIAAWARKKGIGLVATGDWTHPLWLAEIERDLIETGNGLLQLKPALVANKNLDPSSVSLVKEALPGPLSQSHSQSEAGLNFIRSSQAITNPFFLLATEVSCIYSQGGKGRRVHTLIWVPTLESARKINKQMTRQGCNLMSDGRPIIGLTSIQVAELVFTIEPKALIIPAHAWTPWFALFGAMSGFDSLTEAFGKYADQIYAVETGLSSSPAMNWQIKELDQRAIVSFSDAHSGPKLGREATVFEMTELSYDGLYEAIKSGGAGGAFFGDARRSPSVNLSLPPSSLSEVPPSKPLSANQVVARRDFSAPQNGHPHRRNYVSFTIEFFPEEGKYHFTGHRACNIRLNPDESKTKGTTCPVCGKPLTQGVMQRVSELAGRTEEELELEVISLQLLADGPKVNMTRSKRFPNRPPFVMLVPLVEIIAECIGSPVASKKVAPIYEKLSALPGGELGVLLHATHEQIVTVAGERIAAGVDKVRRGDLHIDPGYDGVFGVVKIWKDGEEKPLVDATREQLSLL